ncbi:unnamed protein product [Cyprideis torosa]|uniref:Uncharacterized protein n=1 Tax=Cyprideis torosa TaxID=163714 RepID=A0A7R8W474_9CRUS|nr:unnamed protein product [Cyprideis torosa]CAG0882847.1 unnamed protein product [Cyprideis torosa]
MVKSKTAKPEEGATELLAVQIAYKFAISKGLEFTPQNLKKYKLNKNLKCDENFLPRVLNHYYKTSDVGKKEYSTMLASLKSKAESSDEETSSEEETTKKSAVIVNGSIKAKSIPVKSPLTKEPADKDSSEEDSSDDENLEQAVLAVKGIKKATSPQKAVAGKKEESSEEEESSSEEEPVKKPASPQKKATSKQVLKKQEGNSDDEETSEEEPKKKGAAIPPPKQLANAEESSEEESSDEDEKAKPVSKTAVKGTPKKASAEESDEESSEEDSEEEQPKKKSVTLPTSTPKKTTEEESSDEDSDSDEAPKKKATVVPKGTPHPKKSKPDDDEEDDSDDEEEEEQQPMKFSGQKPAVDPKVLYVDVPEATSTSPVPSFSLECPASPRSNETVMWSKEEAKDASFPMRAQSLANGTLYFPNVTREDGGLYKCSLDTRNNTQYFEFRLIPHVPPSEVQEVNVHASGDSAFVDWQKPESSYDEMQPQITHFSLRYRPLGPSPLWTPLPDPSSDEGDKTTYQHSSGTNTSWIAPDVYKDIKPTEVGAEIQGLKPATHYAVEVRAFNRLGGSHPVVREFDTTNKTKTEEALTTYLSRHPGLPSVEQALIMGTLASVTVLALAIMTYALRTRVCRKRSPSRGPNGVDRQGGNGSGSNVRLEESIELIPNIVVNPNYSLDSASRPVRSEETEDGEEALPEIYRPPPEEQGKSDFDSSKV